MALENLCKALARPPSSAGIARYNNRANSYYYVYRERLNGRNGHRQRSYVSDGDAEHIARHESSRIVRRSQSVQLIDMFQSISMIYGPQTSYIGMGTLGLEKRNRKCKAEGTRNKPKSETRHFRYASLLADQSAGYLQRRGIT